MNLFLSNYLVCRRPDFELESYIRLRARDNAFKEMTHVGILEWNTIQTNQPFSQERALLHVQLVACDTIC